MFETVEKFVNYNDGAATSFAVRFSVARGTILPRGSSREMVFHNLSGVFVNQMYGTVLTFVSERYVPSICIQNFTVDASRFSKIKHSSDIERDFYRVLSTFFTEYDISSIFRNLRVFEFSKTNDLYN